MKLSKVAGYFDNLVGQDAYGTATFLCQFEPLAYSKIDGVAVRKRQISTVEGVTMPARGAILIDGDVYLVGHPAPDYWMGAVIRNTHVIQGADGLADLTSIADALASAPAVSAYAALVFSRYLPDNADSSKYPPQYQVFLAGTESAPANTLILLNGVWFLVKESYISTSGLRIALANVLDEPAFGTATLQTETYDVATDSYTSSPTSLTVLRVKWTEHFNYLSKASETYERGDQQLFLPMTVTPKESDTLDFPDGTWRILAVQDETTHWSCHARRD